MSQGEASYILRAEKDASKSPSFRERAQQPARSSRQLLRAVVEPVTAMRLRGLPTPVWRRSRDAIQCGAAELGASVGASSAVEHGATRLDIVQAEPAAKHARTGTASGTACDAGPIVVYEGVAAEAAHRFRAIAELVAAEASVEDDESDSDYEENRDADDSGDDCDSENGSEPHKDDEGDDCSRSRAENDDSGTEVALREDDDGDRSESSVRGDMDSDQSDSSSDVAFGTAFWDTP